MLKKSHFQKCNQNFSAYHSFPINVFSEVASSMYFVYRSHVFITKSIQKTNAIQLTSFTPVYNAGMLDASSVNPINLGIQLAWIDTSFPDDAPDIVFAISFKIPNCTHTRLIDCFTSLPCSFVYYPTKYTPALRICVVH